MSQARFNNPSGHERKRSNQPLMIDSRRAMASTSSSAFSRSPFGHSFYPVPLRGDAPPASSYFPTLCEEEHSEPQPTPEAQAHFAYSTTLRRHRREDSFGKMGVREADTDVQSLWTKAIGYITGQEGERYERLENGHAEPPSTYEERRNTFSARFAHSTVEVCYTYSVYHKFVSRSLGRGDTN
jgi:P-type Ca2+ transporter type 2C